MFKTLVLSLIWLPSALCGLCRDCDFPYQEYLHHYCEYFSQEAVFYEEVDREQAIFYSGCAYALDLILMMEEKF